ncbi:hypothetical protein ABGB08_53465, partial [Acrocarpospora sp. B8E8]
LERCPIDLVAGSLKNSHHPSSQGTSPHFTTFASDSARWIQAKPSPTKSADSDGVEDLPVKPDENRAEVPLIKPSGVAASELPKESKAAKTDFDLPEGVGEGASPQPEVAAGSGGAVQSSASGDGLAYGIYAAIGLLLLLIGGYAGAWLRGRAGGGEGVGAGAAATVGVISPPEGGGVATTGLVGRRPAALLTAAKISEPGPAAVGPAALEPPVMDLAIADSAALKTAALKTAALKTAAVESEAVEFAAVEAGVVESAAVEFAAAQPEVQRPAVAAFAGEPTAGEPAAAGSEAGEPAAAGFVAAEPAVAEPAAVELAAVEAGAAELTTMELHEIEPALDGAEDDVPLLRPYIARAIELQDGRPGSGRLWPPSAEGSEGSR